MGAICCGFVRKRWVLAALIVLGLAACTESASQAPTGPDLQGDWPQWRGPRRDGSATDPGLAAWADGSFVPEERWRQRLGAGFSSATVAAVASVAEGQRVFTTWVDGTREVLGALDVHTGKRLWTVALGEVKGSAHGDGPRSTPLVSSERGEAVAYAMGSFGDLVAVRAASGDVLWRRALRPLAAGDEPEWAFSASPLLLEGQLIVHLGGPAAVLALDPDTGETLWQTESYRGYASPVVAELAGRRQLLSLTGFGLLGLDPLSGEVLWRFPWDTYYGLNAADPIPVPPDRVFISANYNTGAALLRLIPPADSAARNWTVEEVWTSRRMRNHYATSLHWPGLGMITGFDGDFLAALDVQTGELLWKARGVGKGQALQVGPAADGRMLVLNDACEVLLGTVGRDGWNEVARYDLDLSGTCFAVPSLAGRRLFARDDRQLVAVDVASADSPPSSASGSGGGCK